MKLRLYVLPILVICFLYSNISYAAVFTSIKGGDFNNPETWEEGGTNIPGEMDDVIIKHAVYLNLTNKQTIKSLSLINDTKLFAGLELLKGDSLVILNNLQATSTNSFGNLYLTTSDSTTLVVNGNCNFERVIGNVLDVYLTFTIKNKSKAFINGDLTFEYNGSGAFESLKEIVVKDNALLDVTGESKFTNSAGDDFNVGLYGEAEVILRDSLTLMLTGTGEEAGITLHNNSKLQLLSSAYIYNSSNTNDFAKLRVRETSSNIYIQENVYLESQGAKVKIEAEGTEGVITVAGDIIMNASARCEAYINIIEGGTVNLGGELIRQTSFGNLTMEDEGTLVFNGTTAQSIPQRKLPGSDTDSLFFGKVSFKNTSSAPITLSENLIIQDSLILKEGNLKTSSSAKIILSDSASISGGSKTAYIEGPIQKLGRTGGQPLTLPIGTSSAYAPITISEISNASSDVTVQYASEPPPFGVEAFEAGSGIDNVTTDGYWTVEKNASTGPLNLTLTWEDSNEAGITEPNDLVVVGWDGAEWDNFGQESSGVEGSGGFVTSLNSEPPPFGVEAFTIGSVSTKNVLPVELKRFEATPQSDRVYLEWETESEVNARHFIIEHSEDGVSFNKISIVNCIGSESTSTKYVEKHYSPSYGYNYYRLKIVDNDGTYEYSNIEVVKFDANASVLVYPNPVKDMLIIQAKEWQEGEVTIEIYDRNATKIYENVISFEDGEFQIATDEINIHSNGTYIVRILGKTDSKILKFIKI